MAEAVSTYFAAAPAREWDAYEAVYRQHRDHLYRFALLLVRGDRARAEDIVSEVFIQAYRPWTAGRIDDFHAYTRRAVLNRFKTLARHEVVVGRFIQSHRREEASVDDRADGFGDHDALATAVKRLPPRQRATITLRYYEGLSVDETATALGVSPGTVKSQAAAALESLRRLMGDLDAE